MILTLAAINLNCTDFFKIFNAFNHFQISRNTAIFSEEKKRNPNTHYTYISQKTVVTVIRLQVRKGRDVIPFMSLC
jgi:hypothetical protein